MEKEEASVEKEDASVEKEEASVEKEEAGMKKDTKEDAVIGGRTGVGVTMGLESKQRFQFWSQLAIAIGGVVAMVVFRSYHFDTKEEMRGLRMDLGAVKESAQKGEALEGKIERLKLHLQGEDAKVLNQAQETARALEQRLASQINTNFRISDGQRESNNGRQLRVSIKKDLDAFNDRIDGEILDLKESAKLRPEVSDLKVEIDEISSMISEIYQAQEALNTQHSAEAEQLKKRLADVTANQATCLKRVEDLVATLEGNQEEDAETPIGGGSGGVIHPGPGVVRPKPIYKHKPNYPQLSGRGKSRGTVTVKVLVDESGKVVDVEIVDGMPEFNKEATKAAWLTKFKPATKNGLVGRMWSELRYEF